MKNCKKKYLFYVFFTACPRFKQTHLSPVLILQKTHANIIYNSQGVIRGSWLNTFV